MVINSKKKGSDFENYIVKYLNKKLDRGKFKRVAGSGALGVLLDEPTLLGDVKGEIYGIQRPFKIECKVGYNPTKDTGIKQFTLKKEWLDKIAREADTTFAIPLLIGRFTGSRSGVGNFVVLDLDVFIYLMNLFTELVDDYNEP